MKYVGSKARIANEIKEFILKDRKEGQVVFEPFCGGANFTSKIENPRMCSDVNKYLIACLSAITDGWIPPLDISRELYNTCRSKYQKGDATEDELKLLGYVGINGSYCGRFYDGGYAGISTTKGGKERNYPQEAYRAVMKQKPTLEGVSFQAGQYHEVEIPTGAIIYCDPPYKGTKEYIEAKKSGFKPVDFWEWCRLKAKQGHQIFISEYAAPSDFKCIWEKGLKSSLSSNGKIGGNRSSTERLFVYNG